MPWRTSGSTATLGFARCQDVFPQVSASLAACLRKSTPWPTMSVHLEIVRLGIPRLGTWRKQKQGFYEKVIWPPMALRIGLLRSSALQNDGRIKPVILQCRTPQGTNPKGHSDLLECEVQAQEVGTCSQRNGFLLRPLPMHWVPVGSSSRDRKTGYTKTGYMEEAKTRIL